MELDYLKLVEDIDDKKTYNRFVKVLVASKRAKDLYDEMDDEEKKRISGHKPTYLAIMELNEGKIQPAETDEFEDEGTLDLPDPDDID